MKTETPKAQFPWRRAPFGGYSSSSSSETISPCCKPPNPLALRSCWGSLKPFIPASPRGMHLSPEQPWGGPLPAAMQQVNKPHSTAQWDKIHIFHWDTKSLKQTFISGWEQLPYFGSICEYSHTHSQPSRPFEGSCSCQCFIFRDFAFNTLENNPKLPSCDTWPACICNI